MPTIIMWFNITPAYKAFDLRSTLNLLTCAFSSMKNVVFTAYSCFIAIQKSNIVYKLSYLSMFQNYKELSKLIYLFELII